MHTKINAYAQGDKRPFNKQTRAIQQEKEKTAFPAPVWYRNISKDNTFISKGILQK